MEGQAPRSVQIDRGRTFPLSICRRIPSKCNLLVSVGLLLLLHCTIPVTSAGLERPKYRTAYACEGSTLNMDCDAGHVINLIRANYGRFSITICNEHGNTEWSVNCMSLRSHRVLHDRCSQQQNCSVPASTRGFGDPCPGTLKYLEAHFQCVPVNPTSHTERPRPPWFLATKTTATTITEDRHGASFPRDPPQAIFPPHHLGPPDHKVKTSTTTTIKPPPWLVTNKTLVQNATTTATAPKKSTTPRSTSRPKSTSTTTPRSSFKFSSSTTPLPIVDHYPRHQRLNHSDRSTNEILLQEEESLKKMFRTSTISTTTSWSVAAERPQQTNIFSEEVSWCPPSSGRGLFWNWTRSGEIATQSCPGGASGEATRPCSAHGWANPPDLGMCRSVWLTTLLTRAEDKDSVLAVAQDLTQVTRSRQLYGGDITAAARLVTELTERMGDDVSSFPDGAQLEALVTELVTKVLATVSNLVGRQRLAWGDLRASEHNYAITKLLLGLEEAAFFLADNIHHEKIITHGVPNILMRLQVMETRNVGPVTFPSSEESWPPAEDELLEEGRYKPAGRTAAEGGGGSPSKAFMDFITLPPEALLENSENGLVKMVFFSYQGIQKLLQPDADYRYWDPNFRTIGENRNRTRILNSRVLSASLGAGRHIELSEPVYITFAMIQTINVSNPACVFWDYTTSSWSEEGCRVVRFNTSHTTCQCDHLTNFAVLMDIHATTLTATHDMALSIITYVGCIISIICLLLATVVFHAFRALKNDRTTIHKNLCICLMLAEAIFVGGIARTGQPLVCSLVAGALHYFFLAAFAWMFLEGFQLYIMLSEVFECEKSRARWYYGTAYGIPAFVVAVSAIIDPYSYGTETVCWLRTDNYFIFAFVGPVLLVLMANSVFLILSLVLLCRHAHNSAVLKNKETSRLASLRSWIRGAIIMMFLLGLTWTFGLLYLDQSTVAMAYVFTILNSLQGLFIFVFHCLQNEKKYSFKSCGRDSGHGGSEQEDSPRCAAGPQAKLSSSLRLNNNVSAQTQQQQNHQHPNHHSHPAVSPFAAAAALESSNAILPDYRFASDVSSLRYAGLRGAAYRNQSPWNHTYTEIADGAQVLRPRENGGPVDPVYEEIERRSSEIQVSDLSDEDGRRQSSDISRQSSRSYGDHRPLLPPYTLPDPRFSTRFRPPAQTMADSTAQHQTLDHTIVSASHMVPAMHSPMMNGHVVCGPTIDPEQYQEAMMVAAMGHGPQAVQVQPLSEPNLRSWEAVQRHRDLQQLQHLGEMTVAVLNGEQVVCKLKSPLAPIHENSAGVLPPPQAQHSPSAQLQQQQQPQIISPMILNNERYLAAQTFSHC